MLREKIGIGDSILPRSSRFPVEEDWTLENILYWAAERYLFKLNDTLSEEDYELVQSALSEFEQMSWEIQDEERNGNDGK